MNTIKSCKNCTGCEACYNICPVNAIKMQENKEGFKYPVIDEKLCTLCGICYNRCPELNFEFTNFKIPYCYAVMADNEIRKNSSSGGVFSVLAQEVLNEGGYVCAASYNDKFEVEHIIISNIDDLKKLQGSKYVQSCLKDCLKSVYELLENEKTVLFSGTPCQIAGLYAFLGDKEYCNLITVDLVCHGVPSPLVFKKYLAETVGVDEKIEAVNFRDKVNDWNTSSLLTVKTDKNLYSFAQENNYYIKGFLSELFNRKSCEKCKYTKIKRTGDITLGDFWGISKYNEKLNDYKGTSLVLINNLKGQQILNKIRSKFKHIEAVPVNFAVSCNQVLRRPFRAHSKRNLFFESIDKLSLDKNVKFCLGQKFDVAIFNLWHTCNYGAALTAYALQEAIISSGYSPVLINTILPFCKKKYQNFYKGFDKKYLHLSEFCETDEDFEKLNEITQTFLVGSDQVFRYKYIGKHIDKCLLAFSDACKKRIAFSASFGQNYFECDDGEIFNRIKKLFSRFDYVSTREKSGVNICQNYFGIKADWTLDPVFLADKEAYEKLTDNSDMDFSNKAVSYTFSKTKDYDNLCKKIENDLNIEIYDVMDEKITIEDFLNGFKNAKFILTDSYHGLCFALIFNKPFACIPHSERGIARFESLFDIFDMKDCIYESFTDALRTDNIMKHPDYEKINIQINENKNYALLKLKEALEKPKKIGIEDLITEHYSLKSEISALKKKINEENRKLETKIEILENRKSFFQNQTLAFQKFVKRCFILFKS